MIIHIKSVKSLRPFQLFLTFDDGVSGIVDIEDIIKKGGVFSKLQDYDEFSKVEIDPIGKTVCWGKDIDLAPDSLYARVKK